MKKVAVCVGTRPNLIKITQFEKAFSKYPDLEYVLVHTGQHYDQNMNLVFFKELKIKTPDVQYVLESKSQVTLITEIMSKFEKTCQDLQPDLVVVPGDVNSSLACALVASRMGFPVAHIESGLRSFDRTMPEELNRILIDKLSDLHFVTEQSGIDNLKNENHQDETIKFVGNTMIDTLLAFNEDIEQAKVLERLGVKPFDYLLFTFHRPVNVDDLDQLKRLISLIKLAAVFGQIVFPIHPRTLKNLKSQGLDREILNQKNIVITEPQGYFDFLHLVKNASVVVTDSGGIQEETTFMKVPCLTVRPNTERPSTIEIGSNQLLDFNIEEILSKTKLIVEGRKKDSKIPFMWDGKASERIVAHINEYLNK
jgi:UDP-N-acetylglucosamine 2-epimerase (non-hydrolysing)